ncbi:SRPBCC family protein [Modestobacter lapidis]
MVTEGPGGARRLQFRRSWPDPIADVWAALTEPERLARWIGTYDGERGAGGAGTFTMTQEAEPVGEAMVIVECEPPRRLVVEWTAEEHWRVELDLDVEDGRTVLVFTQAFATADAVGDVATGWHWYLEKFEAELTGGQQPADWDAFLADVGPGYTRPEPGSTL